MKRALQDFTSWGLVDRMRKAHIGWGHARQSDLRSPEPGLSSSPSSKNYTSKRTFSSFFSFP